MFSLEITSWQILLNIVEVKKKGIRVIDGFRKKLMIPDFEIFKCPEYEVKSKIGNIFVNEKIFEEKIYEIVPYFYEHYKKKKKGILPDTLFLKKKDKKR